MVQLDEREHLTGHVAVLAPTADLVVVELRKLVPERGRLRVLVDGLLPAQRRDPAEPAGAVDDRDGATDPASQLACRVRRGVGLRTARGTAALELLLRLGQARMAL